MTITNLRSKTFSLTTSIAFRLFWAWLAILTWQAAVWAQTSTSYSKGTPAESKAGSSSASAYAVDKVETVNLANGNLSVSLPLATVGGRGAAAFTLALSYNSKLWSGAEDVETVDEGFGVRYTRKRFGVRFDEGRLGRVGTHYLGSGWGIGTAPAIKTRMVNIDPLNPAGCGNIIEGGCGYNYVLTKMWLTLPDGSEVEMRDALTDGAPARTPAGANGFRLSIDRDRGRVWQSRDGSAITYVSDAANGVVADQLSGWVFLSDGTRLRMEAGNPSYQTASGTRIIDADGNYLLIENISGGGIAYTDQLGRQTILQGISGGATITVKGYNGAADRVIQINFGQTAALDNLRSDYHSWQQPFEAGDILTYQGGQHLTAGAHTDLFGGDAFVTQKEIDTAVTRLRLLDGREFRFRYNPYSELAEIVYPGGGTTQMDYVAVGSDICEGGGSMSSQLNRQVTERRVLTNPGTVDATWRYIMGAEWVEGVFRGTRTIEARAGTSPSGTLLQSEKHFFLATNAEYRWACGTTSGSNGSGYEKWDNAKVHRIERTTGSGTQITKRVWQQRTPVVWAADVGLGYNHYATAFGQEQPPNDPRVVQEDVILENGKMKRTDYGYDGFNNITSVVEYDFGTETQPGAILRQTARTYVASQNGYCYTNLNGLDASCSGAIPTDMNAVIHQRRLMMSERVADAANLQKAYSEVEYDNYAADVNHAPMVVNAGMIRYEDAKFSLFNSSIQPRGNVTQVKSWVGAADYIYGYSQYDNAGNVVKTKDAKGNISTVSYADNFGNGTNPDSAAGGNFGATFGLPTLATNTLGWQAKTQYDFTLGAASGAKDINGVISRVEFDAIGRVIRTTSALGTPQQVVAETSYPTAASNVATSSSQLDASNWLASKTEFDRFDRAIKSWRAEDGRHASQANFTILAQTILDELGRTKQVSNPYRPALNEPLLLTTSEYDVAGRVTSLTMPDGAQVRSGYDSDRTLVTDQAGKQRISRVNGLGQLVEVWEVTTADAQTVAVSFPNQPAITAGYRTSYGYDTLNNLTTVTQGGQTRSFVYDSLSRLKNATNPESGLMNYQYDANGNLMTKTDAKNIQTNYSYDALNRVTLRDYSDTTPDATYTYDNLPNAKGRLIKVSSSVSQTEYTSFDILGRVLAHKQTTDGNAYTTAYSYNLSGVLLEETYPSGRVVKNTLDNDGDLQQVQSRKANDTFRNYANSFNYTAAGAVSSMRLGNGKWETTQFNLRLQPIQIGLGTSATNQSLLKLNYDYGTTDNNGNVKSQQITVPNAGNNTGFTAIQTYSYDSLNRLKAATENINGNPTPSWKQTFTFDRFGNRNFDVVNTTTLGSCPVNQCNPTVNQTNNRFNSGQGYTYDLAGNVIADAQGRTFTYDAENKQKEVRDVNNSVVGQYFYDGDGKRVKKFIYTTQETTIFVYDASGKMVAEYSTTVAPASEAKVSYLTTDHLGSPRITTDANGQVISRRDFLPFGEEITQALTAQRNINLNYGQDTVRQKFTSYERDNETDLDYAGARYYAKNLGRFNSVDPIMMKRDRQLDPQRINLYGYVRNNPLKFKDVNGEDLVLATKDAKEQKIIKDAVAVIAKTESGRKFLQTLEDSKITFELSVNTNLTTFGKNVVPPGKKGEANGSVIIQVNPDFIQATNEKNKDIKKENDRRKGINGALKDQGQPELPLKKELPVPQGKNETVQNATTLTNELIQATNVIDGDKRNQTDIEETESIPKANAIINDKNKAKGEKPEDFVEKIFKPKDQ